MFPFLIQSLLRARKFFGFFPLVDLKGSGRAFEILECLVSQYDALFNDIVQKILVMRDEHKSARLGAKEAFEPDYCF
jgi:hypothetical protein